jgi:hypothetical protein
MTTYIISQNHNDYDNHNHYDNLLELNETIVNLNETMISKMNKLESKVNSLEKEITILKEDINIISRTNYTNHDGIPYITLFLGLLFPLWFLTLFGSISIVSHNKLTRFVGYLNFTVCIIYCIKIFYDPWWM